MASASTPVAKTEPLPEGHRDKAEALYNKCLESPPDTVFFQRELASMQIAENNAVLMSLLQSLVDGHLMKTLTWENQLCWKARSREEAQKLRNMTTDERLVYLIVDECGTACTWSRTIRNKTGLPQPTLNKVLKGLETKGLVKSIANVKHPARKMYLLSHLQPSADVTGGSWHTEGEFDDAMVNVVCNVVAKYVESETWVHVPVRTLNPNPNPIPQTPTKKDRADAIAKKKAQVQAAKRANPQTPDIEDTAKFVPPIIIDRSKTTLIPRDSTFSHWPTPAQILKYVNESRVLRDVTLNEADLENLLEMMVLDGRLEKRGINWYRTVKGSEDGSAAGWNGFMDAPCGACPVFELCGDEGDITASSCQYFTAWLED